MNAPWIAAQLRTLVRQPGHALLLQGPSGLGQYELALGLARAWLCEQPTEEGACGQCTSCHAIDVRTHADLCMLLPETAALALGWPLSEKAQQEIDDKKRKPSREIRVEAMRDAVEFSQRTSARGLGQVVVVYPAERMNAITANALLKTLEEPAGALRFVLATEAAHQLLPTIRSRCLSHTMAWPAEDDALAWLHGEGVPALEAPVLLRAAGGRPQDALRAHQAGQDAGRWARLPRAVARGDVTALEGLSPPEAVQALQKLCHDLLSVAAGAPPRFFAPADLPTASVPISTLGDWWRELAATLRTAEHPFNPGLMLEALVSRARTALHSGG
ncbi:DNA polymerase III subunit delta' [Ramlibacter rhizophilus]|uniref:DNA polymerase III subunit delta n=1 Tax=Ramlibacter rhizophilus TaxID=1781167 RepID=A0A4Z0C445_9BURK|nr:DNA polymerase III subunit delta' [Ramlibacter rhizophilus]TFZ04965.1 DNA polymerase III subunit delta' [Ramlibacter rhizophilus]